MMLRKLILSDRLELQTDQPGDALRRRLSAQIAPKANFITGAVDPDFRYRGRVDDAGFVIRKSISRNAYRPVIIGRFEPTPGGTVVRVKMRPDYGAMVFVAIWMVVVGIMFVRFLENARSGVGSYGALAVPVYMWGFVLVLMTYTFWQDVADERQALEEIFLGAEEQKDEG